MQQNLKQQQMPSDERPSASQHAARPSLGAAAAAACQSSSSRKPEQQQLAEAAAAAKLES
jgi:hypothetical protein